jgi:hypothetical protein
MPYNYGVWVDRDAANYERGRQFAILFPRWTPRKLTPQDGKVHKLAQALFAAAIRRKDIL